MDGFAGSFADDLEITGSVRRVRVVEVAMAPEELTIIVAAEGEVAPVPWEPESGQP